MNIKDKLELDDVYMERFRNEIDNCEIVHRETNKSPSMLNIFYNIRESTRDFICEQ
jgi:hypothetical protein